MFKPTQNIDTAFQMIRWFMLAVVIGSILVRSLGLFAPKELDEMNKEFLLVTTQSKDDQQVLSMLLRDGALRMSDGERLSLMEMIASHSDQNLEAVRKKIKIQTAMAANRAQLKKDRNTIRRLHGL